MSPVSEVQRHLANQNLPRPSISRWRPGSRWPARRLDVTVQAERTRDVDIALWADGLLRNVRYAVRTLTRTPGFTAAVVLTLALGIGANTAVFSAINAVLLQPLPFPDGDRLMQLRQSAGKDGGNQHRASSSGRLASTELHLRGHHRPLDGERVGDLRRSARESQACVRDGALPGRLGRCARPGARLHARRAPDRGTLCRLDQRSLLAPPVWRRPERGGEERPHREHVLSDRRRHAGLVPLSRPRGRPVGSGHD